MKILILYTNFLLSNIIIFHTDNSILFRDFFKSSSSIAEIVGDKSTLKDNMHSVQVSQRTILLWPTGYAKNDGGVYTPIKGVKLI